MEVTQMLTEQAGAAASGPADGSSGHYSRVLDAHHPAIKLADSGHRSQMSGLGAFEGSTASNGERKRVTFQLVLSYVAQQQARLPLKVYVSPHDTTESIISTVKNFYGLPKEAGISFEDEQGTAIIAQFENLIANSTIFVRVRSTQPVAPLALQETMPLAAESPTKLWLDEPIQLQPSQSFRTSSPSKVHRAGSHRGNSSFKYRDADDAANGMSDSDAGSVSVSSSRAGLASAEISLDNIVEGGRRKRAKFESSELPLFIPPQVPATASMSSASPQRKILGVGVGSPYNMQSALAYGALPSPHSYGRGEGAFATQTGPHYNSTGQRQRGRSLGHGQFTRLSGAGVLPTPDPTIGGSVISDEDVALQLMRLGDPSNFSHGRLSNSTLDETLSGKAEAASSIDNTDAESDVDSYEQPIANQSRKQGRSSVPARKKFNKLTGSGHTGYASYASSEDEFDDRRNGSFKGDGDETTAGAFAFGQAKARPFGKQNKSRTASMVGKVPAKPRSLSKSHYLDTSVRVPPSPYGIADVQRKGSAASGPTPQHFADDEEDLSTRPRCQRCRKSKKGCDRQRPCGRCKDAGIDADGCISEDEGNGRKGRYGRHMGVPVKKDSTDTISPVDTLPHSPAAVLAGVDLNRKRKR